MYVGVAIFYACGFVMILKVSSLLHSMISYPTLITLQCVPVT